MERGTTGWPPIGPARDIGDRLGKGEKASPLFSFLALDQLCCVFPEYYSMLYDSVLRRPSQFYQLSH